MSYRKKHGAEPNMVVVKKKFETALVYACRTKNLEVIHLMMENREVWALDCNLQNVDGETVLMVAVKNGDVDNVWLLMNDASSLNLDLNATTTVAPRGRTAFMLGCFEKEVEAVRAMLELDRAQAINPNRRDEKMNTAFILACKKTGISEKDARIPEMYELLMSYAKKVGIELKAKNNDGQTAFDFYNPK